MMAIHLLHIQENIRYMIVKGETIGVFVITEDMTSDVKALRENQEKAKILTKL